MPKIGSHVSFSDQGLLNAANEAISYGASTFMIYTGAPQNTTRKPIEAQYIEEGKARMSEHHIQDIVVHAPYIINLGSYKADIFKLAVQFLQEEIRRTAYIGVQNIVLHPGAYTDKDATYGISRIVEGLDEVLRGTKDTQVQIALETMAGKGSEMGRSFEEIALMMERVKDHSRLRVCLDTCHIHDAGYDIVHDLDGVLEQFDRIIGLQKLSVIHLNDSKNPRGASKDRHSPIGSGWIGYDVFHKIANHASLQHIPMILETPWIGKIEANERPMYEIEIALLSKNVARRFGNEFIEDVQKMNHYLKGQSIHARKYVEDTWNMLHLDAKAKKSDPREPMERLYDLIVEAKLFPNLTEVQINQRIVGCLANQEVLA